MPAAFTVAIVGSGFSGVMTAAHLLRTRHARPVRVQMLNRSGVMARGVAYGTRSAAHLLNVPAGRMSAYPDDPDHFVRFAHSRDAGVTPASFVCRSRYGEYLEHLLAEAAATGTPNTLEQTVAEVQAVTPGPAGAILATADGRTLAADRVVLAVGHYPPAPPPGLSADFLKSPRYVRDPWARGALEAVATTGPALLIGTGLTMLDVALDLHARGVPRAIALSRRGLLPRPHHPAIPPPEASHRPPGLEEVATATGLLRAARRHIRAGAGDWRQVLDSLRPITPTLWGRLSTPERDRFLRHLRPYWEAHRHRAAPATWMAVERLRQSGWLHVCAARLADASPEGAVAFTPRGSQQSRRERFATVVNCTGPAADVRSAGDPLLTDLLQRGLARTDELGLGIAVAADGAVIAADGRPSPVLSYVGPLLRARDGEGTAVPELRAHAARLAKRLAREIDLAAG